MFKKLASANLSHVVINLIGDNESLSAETIVLDDYFLLLILMIIIPCGIGAVAIVIAAYYIFKLFQQ